MQAFKGDEQEKKFYDVFASVSTLVSDSLDQFFAGAFTTAALGDMLFETRRTPLANAIKQEVYRDAFSQIFSDAFVKVGTFEAYIAVFKAVFGDDVSVEFEVPGPGKLNITIAAEGVELSNWVAREIVDNAYVESDIVDEEGENIAFQTVKGLESEYEVNVMLFEMVPAGIFTQISLTIGGA